MTGRLRRSHRTRYCAGLPYDRETLGRRIRLQMHLQVGSHGADPTFWGCGKRSGLVPKWKAAVRRAASGIAPVRLGIGSGSMRGIRVFARDKAAWAGKFRHCPQSRFQTVPENSTKRPKPKPNLTGAEGLRARTPGHRDSKAAGWMYAARPCDCRPPGNSNSAQQDCLGASTSRSTPAAPPPPPRQDGSTRPCRTAPEACNSVKDQRRSGWSTQRPTTNNAFLPIQTNERRSHLIPSNTRWVPKTTRLLPRTSSRSRAMCSPKASSAAKRVLPAVTLLFC